MRSGSWAPTALERAARFHWVPDAAGPDLSDEEAADAGADYLRLELEARLGSGPVVFSLEASLAAPEDPVDDPTSVWPETRERVLLGTLSVTGIATDRERDGDVLVFDPTRVTDGIECSDDPILRARSGAYRVSVTRRTAP